MGSYQNIFHYKEPRNAVIELKMICECDVSKSDIVKY